MSWRTGLRRLRFAAMAVLATAVIALGVVAGLTQLAMPWLSHHPQHVERWLTQRLGRPVAIGQVHGTWLGGGPVLTLDDVRIDAGAAGGAPLAIARAELVFDLFAPFRRNRAFSEFGIAGLDLHLVREDGRWALRGLDFAPSAGDDASFSMGALGAFELRDLKLTIDDAAHALHLPLQLPVLRLLNRGETTRVVGRVRLLEADSPPLELVADVDAGTRSGTLYVGGRDVDLAHASAGQKLGGVRPAGGRGDVQVWARVESAAVTDVRARVALRDVVLDGGDAIAVDGAADVVPRAAFERLAFAARWLRADGGWNFDLADFVAGDGQAPPARLALERRGGDDRPQWRGGATVLPLEPLGDLAMLSDAVPPALRRWLYLARPGGRLADAAVRWNGVDDYDARARLRGFRVARAGAVPGVDSLDADLDGDAQALLVALPPQPLEIDCRGVFRKAFAFADFGGDVVVRRQDDAGWRIETDRVAFEGEGYGGELRGGIDLHPQGRPSLDLYAYVTHGEVAAAKLFWPTTSMSPKAIAWLDRGLVSGRVVEGRAALVGDLADWPFRDHSGRMVARAEIADTTLVYDDGWPRVDKLHAHATFVDTSLQVDADAGESMGVKLAEASASIADFGTTTLDLSARGGGSGAELLGFLRASPIGRRYQDALKDVAIGGRGTFAFKLNLPVRQVEALSLDGSVALSGAKLDHTAFDLHFLDASGPVRFDQKGFAAGPLETRFRDRPVQLTLAAGGAVADPHHAFEAGLSGRFPAATVFADVPVLLPALAVAPGESLWNAAVAIDASPGGDGRKQLTLASDLRGIAIDLPAPLAKPAAAALPFRLALELPPAGRTFDATLGDVAAVRGRVPAPDKPFAARVQFGGTAGDPPPDGVVIGGRAAELDLGGWIDLARAGGDAGGSLVRRVDLTAGETVFGGRRFDGLRFEVEPAAAATALRVDGEAIAGRLTIPAGAALARDGITATLDRVHWPDAPPGSENDDDPGALAGLAPATLPPFHLHVADFRLGAASFGTAEFESRPVADGMRVERMETHSPNITMKASGEWTGSAKNNRSRLGIELSAQNLGHMLDALGFSGLIDGGVTKASITAEWPGPPSTFALSRLDGTLEVDVGEGRIPDVEPGAGRLFGLLSLTEIPRRLSLDFSDFFRSGFSFNSIKGTFRLAHGDAWTDGLVIKSPSADIVVTGRTGLRAKDYDQRMMVTPHAGATLPVVGAIAGGPVGAAAGLVMQGILSKPLGKIVALEYSVTGSWDKPKIATVARRTREAEPAKPPAKENGKPRNGLR